MSDRIVNKGKRDAAATVSTSAPLAVGESSTAISAGVYYLSVGNYASVAAADNSGGYSLELTALDGLGGPGGPLQMTARMAGGGGRTRSHRGSGRG